MRAPPACSALRPIQSLELSHAPHAEALQDISGSEFIRLSWAFSVQEQIHFALFAVLGYEELTYRLHVHFEQGAIRW